MKKVLAGCGLALFLLAQPALAADDMLELLARKGIITAEEYANLKAAQASDIKASFKDGFKLSTGDGNNTIQFGTQLQFDAAHFAADQGDAADGTELRRARLSVSGTVQKDWDFRTEIEFAGNTAITDAYVTYKGFEPVSITVGQFKTPYSLDSLTSDKGLLFMERALPFAFLNARAPGIMIAGHGDNWTASAALVGEQLTTQTVNDEGGGFGTRLTWAPLFASGRVLHLGGSSNWRQATQSNAADKHSETVRFSSRPESNLFQFAGGGSTVRSLVDTGELGGTGVGTCNCSVDSYLVSGFELAGVYGPLAVQSEYTRADVRRSGADDVGFSGWYGQAAYVLTGEVRGYRADKGLFDSIRPTRASGAWEVAGRYSNLDLQDGPVGGGEESNMTLALNWYLNSLLRVSANYVKVLTVDGGAQDGNEPDTYQMRAQLAF